MLDGIIIAYLFSMAHNAKLVFVTVDKFLGKVIVTLEKLQRAQSVLAIRRTTRFQPPLATPHATDRAPYRPSPAAGNDGRVH